MSGDIEVPTVQIGEFKVPYSGLPRPEFNVVELPVHDPTDIPARLRSLAAQIEAGEYGDAHNLAWVLDCGSGRIEMGLLGRAATIGAEAHLLFCVAAHKIECGCISTE